MATKTE